MPRKPAHQTVQREDILLAAAQIFQERGFDGATMAQIARRVHLTAGSLYHHFPAGKRDLLLAVLNTGLDAVLHQFEQLGKEVLPAPERLRAMILAHVLSVTQNVAVGAAMVFEIRTLIALDQPDAERDAFLQRRDTFEQRYRDVIQQGIAAGDFRPLDVNIFVKALLGAHNWISVWYRGEGRLSGREIGERMVDTFLSALRCP
ncbi:MAG TPA: TetR/AcrR family transcriptional regulator [Aggregatilineales bacterium]|nr:TetR/AcrR family transcriptional regulator [Aggregatilineales bacterium]